MSSSPHQATLSPDSSQRVEQAAVSAAAGQMSAWQRSLGTSCPCISSNAIVHPPSGGVRLTVDIMTPRLLLGVLQQVVERHWYERNKVRLQAP